jgi:hypothetical protein
VAGAVVADEAAVDAGGNNEGKDKKQKQTSSFLKTLGARFSSSCGERVTRAHPNRRVRHRLEKKNNSMTRSKRRIVSFKRRSLTKLRYWRFLDRTAPISSTEDSVKTNKGSQLRGQS